MPRSSRIVIAGCAHHVTQRGNNRQDVFFVDDDRRVFLALLAEVAERFGNIGDVYRFLPFKKKTDAKHRVETQQKELNARIRYQASIQHPSLQHEKARSHLTILRHH